MKSRDGITVPTWKDIGPAPRRDPPTDAKADVCVVGAGIAGLSVAYMLAKEGRSVIVLDEGPIGGGQTGRTSAHLASAIDDRFYELERHHGVEGSRAAYESNAAAIDAIERISREEGIDCDFSRLDGYLFPIPGESPETLDKELAAAHRAGFTDARKVDAPSLSGCRLHGPCLRFPRQGRFHPLKYLYGLAAAAERHGVRIYNGCRVTDVQGADPAKGEPARATLDDGRATVRADAIVVATNTPAPINSWFGIYTKQSSYRTYIVAAAVPRGAIADALYWDDGDPYHYVRLEAADPASVDRQEDLLIIGGADHKVGQLPEGVDPFADLLAWARQNFAGVGEVRRIWSGQVQEPSDYVAYIGAAPKTGSNVYVATGDSGQGITHGTLAGLILTDLIAGRPNPWAKLYDPTRKTLNYDYVSENANVVAQYKDLVTGGDTKSILEIAPGEGKVMREGASKVAVYRDKDDRLHKCSAVCTHLGCIVQWNPIEKSWDCPCHGSRFDPYGKVVMGPAITDLGKA